MNKNTKISLKYGLITLVLLALIILIGQVNKNIIKLYFNLDNKLSIIRDTIIDIHPNYKYKKVYESKRYEQNIK